MNVKKGGVREKVTRPIAELAVKAVRVDRDVWKSLKLYAARREISIGKLIKTMLEMYRAA